jgi:hypothetical protein
MDEIKRVLQNIIVSRVFTIYQLANLVINELPRIIEQLSSDTKTNLALTLGLPQKDDHESKLKLGHISNIYVDAANPEVWESLKREFNESCNQQYIKEQIAECKNTTYGLKTVC